MWLEEAVKQSNILFTTLEKLTGERLSIDTDVIGVAMVPRRRLMMTMMMLARRGGGQDLLLVARRSSLLRSVHACVRECVCHAD
jgi:hypothetical protein